MHLHPHIRTEIARDVQARRVADARRASIDVRGRRQSSSTRRTLPARRVLARLIAAVQRPA
jgi:hypothetical protein